MFRCALLAAILILAPNVPAIAQNTSGQGDIFYGGFDGRWEGTLNFVPPESFSKDHGFAIPPQQMVLAINGKSVSVYPR